MGQYSSGDPRSVRLRVLANWSRRRLPVISRARWPLYVMDALLPMVLVTVGFTFIVGVLLGIAWIIRLLVGGALGVMGEYVPLSVLQVGVGLGALLLGGALFRLRCRWPMLYGMVEIALGILFAGYVVNQILGMTLREANAYFTVAGSLYVIVRGFDNVYKTLTWGSPLLRLMNVLFFGRHVCRRL